jgi:hypothetical protein
VRDLSHYGDPPTPPRDETRALRIIARVVVFAALGFVSAALAAALLGWR